MKILCGSNQFCNTSIKSVLFLLHWKKACLDVQDQMEKIEENLFQQIRSVFSTEDVAQFVLDVCSITADGIQNPNWRKTYKD